MQMEMESGGKLFFDLFVAIVRHASFRLYSRKLTRVYSAITSMTLSRSGRLLTADCLPTGAYLRDPQ
jgi:hypothetical protein